MLMHSDSAEFGEGIGGTINLITKSGTNTYHGAVWEYWRSSQFLDAANFRADYWRTCIKTSLAANVGGPVMLPHYNGKDRIVLLCEL